MTNMSEIIIIAHNIRSTHNVGALFRTADGFGVSKIILSGYTPYPRIPRDPRLPHIADKLTAQIHKTALGAEKMVTFEYSQQPWLDTLKADGYRIVGLEQTNQSVPLHTYLAPEKVALLIGEEVHGIKQPLLDQCDDIIEITMVGKKESFNVSVATGIALYALTT
ncbi:MAG: TrmH family RNA methyltransferase [Candidatus Microsaccharimonas sossegonensis]|uniref:TrmH family RNA methyltransferase n=1 Tax=Candidatus Microsaccharimonas sossegonensis TaxID=2506948 RepID=A0A4Q0AIG8_9BACT|nr:MAG: TrmH family RNA methyltransferase [Candidatus Microsaccharimonas sossegonensis]